MENVLEHIDSAPELFNMLNSSLPFLSVDAWTQIFESTSIITSKKNPKRKYKDFGISLAGTHPQNLLPLEDFHDSKILESPIACALGGAYHFYGCIWVKNDDFLINWTTETIKPTELWNKFPIKTRNLATAFSHEEMFNKDSSSLHCIEASMAAKMKVKQRDNPEEWMAKLEKALNSTGQVMLGHGTIKDALMRLAKMHPSTFGKDHIMDDSKLLRSSMTALWTAPYWLVGGAWLKPQQLGAMEPEFTLVQSK
jgi:hypothetical protein